MKNLALAILFAISVLSAGERSPVMAELFTSEGCSSCPPADALLAQLDAAQPVNGARIVVLSEHVDYWDDLGWKDPFSSSQFSERQRGYARRLRLDSVYTPQLVIDGHDQYVGGDARKIIDGITRAAVNAKSPVHIGSVQRQGSQAAVEIDAPALDPSAKVGQAELWIAIASDRETSQVRRGENSGRNLTHVSVARELRKIGTVTRSKGLNQTIHLPVNGSGRIIAFLQEPNQGAIAGTDEKNF